MTAGTENDNIRWSIFMIILTMWFIVLEVGPQTKDITESVTLGMPVTSVMINYINLFIFFPVCFFVFVRHVRRLGNNYIKGCLFLFQAVTIGFYGFFYIDNSHPGVDMNTESAMLTYSHSDTIPFVYFIIIIDILLGVVYLFNQSNKQ